MCRISEKGYEALWVTAEDVAEEGLLLSRHMLLDHLPDRTINVLSRALARNEAHSGGCSACEVQPAPVQNECASGASGVQLPEIEVEDRPSETGSRAEAAPGLTAHRGSQADLRSRSVTRVNAS